MKTLRDWLIFINFSFLFFMGCGESKTSEHKPSSATLDLESPIFNVTIDNDKRLLFSGACSETNRPIEFSNDLPDVACLGGKFSKSQDLSHIEEDRVEIVLTHGGFSFKSPIIYLSSYMKLKVRTTENNDSVTLPIELDQIHDEGLSVNWGVEEVETQAITEAGHLTHAYARAGDYTITLKGKLKSFRPQGFCNGVSDFPLVQVPDAGDFLKVSSLKSLFQGCSELEALGGGDTSLVTSMASMFYNAPKAKPYVRHWNTSSVTTMANMFFQAPGANPNLSEWDFSGLRSESSESPVFGFLSGSGISVENYSNFLIQFNESVSSSEISVKILGSSVALDSHKYNSKAFDARNTLIEETSNGGKGWTIHDGGCSNCLGGP